MSESDSDTEIVFDVYDPPPEFEELLNLQELVLKINMQNYESIAKDITSSNYFKTEHGLNTIVVNVLNAVKYRPTQHLTFAHLLKQLLGFSLGFSNPKLFRIYFLSQFRAIIEDPSSFPRESATIAFFYDAFTLDCFTIEEIIALMKQIYVTSNSVPTESSIVLFFYFSKEINYSDTNFFNDLLTNVMNSEERALSHEVHDALILMNDLFANDFQMLQCWRLCHCIPDSLADSILRDDPEMLHGIIIKERLTYDVTIPSNIFGLSEFVNHNPTLIHFASFFGSVKCFKFLFLNKDKLSLSDDRHMKLVHFAVAGGNTEIIHILEQSETLFSRTLPISIEYNHYELFEWLYEKFYDSRLYEDVVPIQVGELARKPNNAHSTSY